MNRLLATAAAVLLLSAGCGNGLKSALPRVSTSTSSKVRGLAATGGGEDPLTSSTVVGATGAGATATGGGHGPSTAATFTATSSSGVPNPTNSGTYDYDQTGEAAFGQLSLTGTLAVDPPSGGVQVQHRHVDDSTSTVHTTIAFRSDGPFITDQVFGDGDRSARCHYDQPIPAPPWPASTGKQISGHADCGPITSDMSGSIIGQRTTTLDGKSIDVIVIKTTTTVHGQIASTTEDEQWWAPSLRLIVHEHQVSHGTIPGRGDFDSDITSDLRSATPH